MIVALSIVLFLALLLLGLDVGFSMIAAALIGLLLHPSGGIDPAIVALTLVSAVDSEALVAVAPLVHAEDRFRVLSIVLELAHGGEEGDAAPRALR